MTSQNNAPRKRRPGPVEFQGESKITSFKINSASNESAIGKASAPKKETASRTKDLKVQGPLLYFILGIIFIIIGLFVSLFITSVGVFFCIASIMTNRTNKTRSRLRKEFGISSSINNAEEE